jgi:hypothetical protein
VTLVRLLQTNHVSLHSHGRDWRSIAFRRCKIRSCQIAHQEEFSGYIGTLLSAEREISVTVGAGSGLWCEESEGELGGCEDGTYSVRSIFRAKELYFGNREVSDVSRSPLVNVL